MSVESPARPASKREHTKAQNRAAILEAGREVFGELGYDAASVRDIIRRTGLAAGTFYNYFPDKASIFRAVMEETADEARLRVGAARARATSLRSFVEDAYRAYFELIVEDPATFAFMRRNAETIRTTYDDRVLPATYDELVRDLRGEVARGGLGDIDVEYTAHAMIAVGLELGTRLIERDPPDVARATRFAADLFLGGLARIGAAKP